MKSRALRAIGAIQRLARILGPALLVLAVSLSTTAAERPPGATAWLCPTRITR